MAFWLRIGQPACRPAQPSPAPAHGPASGAAEARRRLDQARAAKRPWSVPPKAADNIMLCLAVGAWVVVLAGMRWGVL